MKKHAILVAAALTLCGFGCSDDDDKEPVTPNAGGTNAGGKANNTSGKATDAETAGMPANEGGAPSIFPQTGGAGGEDSTPTARPLYALAILVFGPESTTTYVSLFDSLDVSEIDVRKAYEFPGGADIATLDGNLFVSDGESPIIHRYAVGTDGKLREDGAISFANYGLEEAGLRDNLFISSSKAYLNTDTGEQIIWDPAAMEITGTIEVPDLNRDGFILDGAPGVVRGNRMYKTWYWEDWASYTFSEEQYVATFDTKNDKFLGMVAEDRCPNLGAVAQKGDDDTVYLSNWFYNVPGTLMKDAPKSCVLRIPKGQDTVDPDWSLTFSDITGGHEGAQLSYIADGKAVFAAFHEEDFTITAETAAYEIPSAVNWEAWGVDLAAPETAAAITGMDRMVADQTVFRMDGRTFLLAPGADWLTTQAYELLDDGSGRPAFTIDGWSRGFLKIR